MSIDDPPLYSNITYNSLFFPQDVGFTQAQANLLYLKKTTPDTATANETFQAGLKTNSIEPLNDGDATIIAGSSGFNPIQIANANSRNALGTISIGSGSTSSGVISLGSGNASSNTINILNGSYTTFQSMGIVNILSGTVSGSWLGGDMNLFRSARGTLTIGGSNNLGITFNKEPNFSVGLSSTGNIRANTLASFTGGTNTIYTDPNTPQTYNTTVCSNNLACSFGASAGSCNLGGSAAAVNIGFNMPSLAGSSISIGTAGVQDTNVLIATKGAIVSGTNKIQVGASGNVLNVVCGNITLGTGDSAISIGSSSSQSSNIVIGTKGALITGSDKVVIGSATNVLTLGSGTINVNAPLTPNYDATYNATTGTGSGKVGYIFETRPAPVVLTANTPKTVATLTNIPAGVWILQGSCETGNLGADYSFLGFSTADNVLQQAGASNMRIFAGATYNQNCQLVISLTTATTYYMTAQVQLGQSVGQLIMQAVRIA
jgi:hypothetical protein